MLRGRNSFGGGRGHMGNQWGFELWSSLRTGGNLSWARSLGSIILYVKWETTKHERYRLLSRHHWSATEETNQQINASRNPYGFRICPGCGFGWRLDELNTWDNWSIAPTGHRWWNITRTTVGKTPNLGGQQIFHPKSGVVALGAVDCSCSYT